TLQSWILPFPPVWGKGPGDGGVLLAQCPHRTLPAGPARSAASQAGRQAAAQMDRAVRVPSARSWQSVYPSGQESNLLYMILISEPPNQHCFDFQKAAGHSPLSENEEAYQVSSLISSQAIDHIPDEMHLLLVQYLLFDSQPIIHYQTGERFHNRLSK